jgi:hypothetical protein
MLAVIAFASDTLIWLILVRGSWRGIKKYRQQGGSF